jgi:hypothetical protein
MDADVGSAKKSDIGQALVSVSTQPSLSNATCKLDRQRATNNIVSYISLNGRAL